MPRGAIGVDLAECSCQRLMRNPPLSDGLVIVRGRSGQGMSKPHMPSIRAQQAVALGWLQRMKPESEFSCRAFQDRELALFLGRGQQDEHEGLVIQCVEAGGEELFDLLTNR